MEKLKNIISPGHKKDEEKLYDEGASATGHGHGHGHGNTGPSSMPGGFGDDTHGTSGTSSSHNPLSSKSGSNKPLPTEPGYGNSSNTVQGLTSGTSSGRTGGLEDPSFSNRSAITGYGSRDGPTTGGSSFNRDASMGETAGTGLTGRHHTPGSGLTGTSDRIGNDNTPTSGLGGSGSGLTGSGYDNTSSGLGGSGSGLTGSGYDNTSSGLGGSGIPDRSRGINEPGSSALGSSGGHFPLGGHMGDGPHETATANILDPHVHGGSGGLDGTSSGMTGSGMTGSGMTGSGMTDSGMTGSGMTGSGSGLGSSNRDPTSTSGLGTTGSGLGSSSRDPYDKTSSGLGSSTRDPSDNTSRGLGSSTRDPTSTTGHHGSHLGRNAAIGSGAGAGALGASELGSRGDSGRGLGGSSNDPSMTTGGSGGQYDNLSSGTPSGIAASDANLPGTTGSSTSRSADPMSSSTTGGHHYGRDAAGVGAAGGAGALAEHEYEKHRGNTGPSGMTGSSGGQYDQLGSGTPSGISSGYNDQTTIPGQTSSTSGTTGTSSGHHGHHHGHHHGRDAAAVGGTGAAAGLGSEELRDRAHDSGTTGRSTVGGPAYSGTSSTMMPSSTTSSSKPAMNMSTFGEDPISATNSQGRHATTGHHGHHGTEAAAGAGGASGAALAAEHEHDKHSKHHDSTSSHEKKPGLMDKLLGRDPAHKEAKQEAKLEKEPAKHAHDSHSHASRNAGLAGAGGVGAGAAGYEAYEHGRGQHTGESDTGPASKTMGHHSSNLANIVDPRVHPEPEKMHGTKTNTGSGLDPRVEGGRSTGTGVGGSTDPYYTGSGGTGTGTTGLVGNEGYTENYPAGSSTATTTTGTEHEKKQGGLSGLLHRDNPNKLHKDPPHNSTTDQFGHPEHQGNTGSTSEGTSHHMGVDGPIGRH